MHGQTSKKLITKITLLEEEGNYKLRKELSPINLSYEITTTNITPLKI